MIYTGHSHAYAEEPFNTTMGHVHDPDEGHAGKSVEMLWNSFAGTLDVCI